MIELAKALDHVVTVLEERAVPYAVVGSVAAANWGVVRMTRDVDLVLMLPGRGERDETRSEVISDALAGSGFYVPAADAIRALSSSGSFNVLHPHSGGKVDIFVAEADDAFTQSRLARRHRSTVLGVDVWVASPEDVVLAKLRWRLESRSETQWRDCVEIAAIQLLDVEYLNGWASRLGVADDLADLLAVAEG